MSENVSQDWSEVGKGKEVLIWKNAAMVLKFVGDSKLELLEE